MNSSGRPKTRQSRIRARSARPIRRGRWSPAVRPGGAARRRGPSGASVIVSVLVSGEVALDQGDGRARGRRRPARSPRRSRSAAAGSRCGPPGRRGGGRVQRAALGHDVDLGEQAERGDGDGDQDEGAGLPQARPGDVAELLPRAGAVECRPPRTGRRGWSAGRTAR